MIQLYKDEGVARLQAFYGDLLHGYWKWSVEEHLSMLAQRLFQGYQNQEPVVAQEINNYHPDWLGKSPALIFDATLQLTDMQQTIASEYGFRSWDAVTAQDQSYDADFECALDAILSGNVAGLQSLLRSNSALVNQTSTYGHRATLLHYTGSNGVELWRQQVPMNLAEIVAVLLEEGSDKAATMAVYGGAFTALQLLETSAHPEQAGVVPEVKKLLQ